MIISVDRVLFYKRKYFNNFKRCDTQLSLNWCPEFNINLTFDYNADYNEVFSTYINLFGLLKLKMYQDKETDHAGFHLNTNLFGLEFDLNYEDQRHWDDDNDCWKDVDEI